MTDIRFIAKGFIDQGWAVVPLVKGEKRASTSWRTKTYSPQDFGSEDGIALKCGEPSGWRVDVDLDCIEAVHAARELLPQTQLIHGRPSKPSSHYWYICKDIKTTQFTDMKDGALGAGPMLVEIRSTGGYTAAPPSTHPSGESLEWEVQRDPMSIEPQVLYESVRDVAIVAILARHWQDYGHHAIGPIAGFLTTCGLTNVVQLIELVARIAGANADTIRDAKNFAETTVAKARAGEKVTGGPTLAQHIPEAIVDKIRSWCKMADLDAIDEMNAKHFWVRMGKDDVIGREDTSHVIFQRPKALYTEYANRKIIVGQNENGKPEVKPLFQAWLEAKNRRSYKEVVFAPPPKDKDLPAEYYNLWAGYGVQPVEGKCDRFLAHLEHVICSDDKVNYEYLLKLLARTCQAPGLPLQVATVMRGEIGAGKGTLMRMLERIFKRHYTQLDKVEQLVGQFNAAISGKVIVFADEAFWAGDKREVGALKRLITEPTLHIVRKGIDGTDEDNHVHLFMATNEEWAIPAGMKERRFFAVKVASERMKDRAYFNAIYDEMNHGGAEAFLDMMLKYPVTADEIRDVPMTEELRVQQAQSLPAEQKWWQESLVSGKFEGSNIVWSPWIRVDDLYTAYKLWVRDYGGRLLDKIEFSRRMGSFISATGKTGTKRMQGQVERAWPVRTLDEARSYFDQRMQTQTAWDTAQSASPAPTNPFAETDA